MGHRTWVYHATEDAKIVDSDEAKILYENGWRDSPAPFVDIKDFGITADNKIAVQQLGDTIQGVADSLNGALNLDLMDKDELEEYAKEHYGKDVDRRKSLKNLRKEVKCLIDGNSN